MIRTQVSPRAYFAQEKDRQAKNESIAATHRRRRRRKYEKDLTGADRCKKNLQNRNLFIGHSVKRSFVRSFMMSYLSGKKSRLILHSIVPNILYKGRWLFMLLSKSRNFFWSKRYLIFLKVLDFYQKNFPRIKLSKFHHTHAQVQSKIYVPIVAFLSKSWNII